VYDENANLIEELQQSGKTQQRILKKYGNFVCLLDATYKTTKYAIPLFFVATKTNVDYQSIGSFATQDETTASITEALDILKGWNKNWNSKVFLVDNCEEEIQALESLFGKIITLCTKIPSPKVRMTLCLIASPSLFV